MGVNSSQACKPSHIVAHRGFHSVDDDCRIRPLENTLKAFDTAWRLGYIHAECDVTVSGDGLLFLCHDSTFKRLIARSEEAEERETQKQTSAKALIIQCISLKRNLGDIDVCDLTSHQITHDIKLKDGSPPCTLKMALECALRISRNTGLRRYLVIEIKRGKRWEYCIEQLNAFFFNRPDLTKHVSVITSFDADIMKRIVMFKIPSVSYMLLTVSPNSLETDGENEICLDCTRPDFVSTAKKLIGDTNLDGIYFEYQPGFNTEKTPEILKAMNNLRLCMKIGIWNRARIEPDCLSIPNAQESLGISFLNSDLPDELL